jgi:6-phosphogluconolactonase
LNSTVTAFACDAGRLVALQTISILPEGLDAAGFGTAEIVLHPNGRWLYVSNRDTSHAGRDGITVLAVAPDGRLRCVETVPAQVQMPRSFDLDPSGRWLVVASQTDHRLAVLRIDPATGKLEPTKERAEVSEPVCVLFAPQP